MQKSATSAKNVRNECKQRQTTGYANHVQQKRKDKPNKKEQMQQNMLKNKGAKECNKCKHMQKQA